MADGPRPSLVDATERAVRERIQPGRRRPGDRLPPEKELAAAVGVSRGTLRLALERLELNGEIVRRQGSGTFVGRVAVPAAFDQGLEVLESYTSLARRQGRRLTAHPVAVRTARAPGYVAEALGVARRAALTSIERTIRADGIVAAHMREFLRPGLPLPPAQELASSLEAGEMVLDVLLEQQVPVAFARTHIRPRLIEPGAQLGKALEVSRTTGALELVETLHLRDGTPVQYSINVFPPGAVELHVMRGLGD